MHASSTAVQELLPLLLRRRVRGLPGASAAPRLREPALGSATRCGDAPGIDRRSGECSLCCWRRWQRVGCHSLAVLLPPLPRYIRRSLEVVNGSLTHCTTFSLGASQLFGDRHCSQPTQRLLHGIDCCPPHSTVLSLPYRHHQCGGSGHSPSFPLPTLLRPARRETDVPALSHASNSCPSDTEATNAATGIGLLSPALSTRSRRQAAAREDREGEDAVAASLLPSLSTVYTGDAPVADSIIDPAAAPVRHLGSACLNQLSARPSTSRAARWRWSNAASSGTATARAPLCCAQWACCLTNTRTRTASL